MFGISPHKSLSLSKKNPKTLLSQTFLKQPYQYNQTNKINKIKLNLTTQLLGNNPLNRALHKKTKVCCLFLSKGQIIYSLSLHIS